MYHMYVCPLACRSRHPLSFTHNRDGVSRGNTECRVGKPLLEYSTETSIHIACFSTHPYPKKKGFDVCVLCTLKLPIMLLTYLDHFGSGIGNWTMHFSIWIGLEERDDKGPLGNAAFWTLEVRASSRYFRLKARSGLAPPTPFCYITQRPSRSQDLMGMQDQLESGFFLLDAGTVATPRHSRVGTA